MITNQDCMHECTIFLCDREVSTKIMAKFTTVSSNPLLKSLVSSAFPLRVRLSGFFVQNAGILDLLGTLCFTRGKPVREVQSLLKLVIQQMNSRLIKSAHMVCLTANLKINLNPP